MSTRKFPTTSSVKFFVVYYKKCRDEDEVNIPRKSLSLRRIIVLVFLHIQMNIRNNCPSLYTKVIFLREIICSPKMLFMLL